ncbi:lysophospholipid acyltransferase family protein [Alkaliphilus sp. B6464]|uniref:lysophospholipid acyltransferase family protein n=1 Tax=Alkaliphilus sp. B6464 TaxID=2731219 RepID=UPI001BEDBD17|nr:lysophospholipid acyltransferase family protein [Alkaliphilus sp. B6464]QUH21676.1 1-acyl-sn-glycerol-3-phosphate acyltransferase [Alkaliphilus sp. B6464]
MFYKVVKNSIRFILSLIYRVEIQGKENIPMEGKSIVCSNHFNLLDPVFIGTCLPRKINYMAKEELFSNKIFALILNKLGVFPVKRGGADISAIKTALKILKNEEVFGIFPEGTRSKTGEMLEAKPGLAMIAIKSQSSIIPVAIIGNYKPFSKIKIIIDKPINFSDYYDQKISIEEYQQLSQSVLEHIKKLMN